MFARSGSPQLSALRTFGGCLQDLETSEDAIFQNILEYLPLSAQHALVVPKTQYKLSYSPVSSVINKDARK